MKEYIARRVSAVHVIDATGNEVPSDLLNSLGISLITNEAVQPPTLGPAIADRTYVVGSAPVTIDLSQRFIGAISYGMSPTNIPGVTRSGAIVTIDPATTRATTAITVSGTNTAGTATMTFNLTVNAVSPTLTTPLPDRSLTVGGAAVTLALGDYFANAASYAVSPTGQGVSISGSTLTISAAAERNGTYTVTASNSTGQTVSDAFALVVAAAVEPLTPADYWTYVEPSDAPGATGANLTTLTARGAGAPAFAIAATGAAPTKEADAIRFNLGQYFMADGLTIPAGDGFILAADFTPHQITGTQNVISIFTSAGVILGTIRSANAAHQYNVGVGINGTAANVASGTAVAGTRVQMAIEFDRVAGTIRHWNLATGAVVSQALTYSGPINAVRISIGQASNHSVHKAAVVTRPTGAAWATTLEEVLADFDLRTGTVNPEPVPFTAMDIYASTGQSLGLGLNMGGQASPSGTVWRTVLQNQNVQMLTGHQRKDSVAVASVSAPLLQGYNTAISATGNAQASAVGNVPPSFIGAVARARDGLSAGRGISYQFHGAGGQSVTNLDSSTGEGTTVIPWENFTFSVGQQASYWSGRGVSVNCPVFSYNQGEADVAQPRGWWLSRFTTLYNETVSTVRTATGQTSGPQLYLYQTGGYMNKVNGHQVVLDQLDAVRNLSGVLVAPIYWQKISNDDARGVHMGTQGNLQLGELENWAITEHEAGRSWNLLPPVTVTRTGDTITIPITVRSDETLTTSPGKYADYGGDPANLGLEVDGGGSITSASVSGGNIVLQVSGIVTAVRYAMQTTGIDYRTLTDAELMGYATHRGIIRTTLTRTRTVGGLALTMERAVPSFSVAITQAPALSGGSLEVS